MKRVLFRALAVAVGAPFVYAGVLKALDPAQFALDVQNFRLVPWTACVLIALYLPWLEIVCGGALVLGRAGARGALWLITAMLLVFTAAILFAKMRGLDIACGCFGHGAAHGFATAFARDLALLAACGTLLTKRAPR